MVYRNKEGAKRLFKQGGAPWKFPYEVVATHGFGVKLKATPGAPRVFEWQPLHRVTLAPPEFHDEETYHSLGSNGLALAPGESEVPEASDVPSAHPLYRDKTGQKPNDDGTYDIEHLVSARKENNKWKILIKWVGWATPTEETRSWFFKDCNCTDPEIRAKVDELIDKERERTRAHQGAVHVDDDDLEDEHPGATDDAVIVDTTSTGTYIVSAISVGCRFACFLHSRLNILRGLM